MEVYHAKAGGEGGKELEEGKGQQESVKSETSSSGKSPKNPQKCPRNENVSYESCHSQRARMTDDNLFHQSRKSFSVPPTLTFVNQTVASEGARRAGKRTTLPGLPEWWGRERF